jgi:superfamily II DNA/RNA helicase
MERFPVTLLDAARAFPSVFELTGADSPAADETAVTRVRPDSGADVTVRTAVSVVTATTVNTPATAPVAATVTAPAPAAATVTDLTATTVAGPATVPAQSVGFATLGVPGPLVRLLARAEITTAFPIQVVTIPDALAGRDILGRARTGSGKTLAFGLPMVARLAVSGRSAPRRPKGLVLVPTRELAMQVNDAICPLARVFGLFTKTAFGGAPYGTQISSLERGVDVLVATPGRLADLIERGACSLAEVEITVLDECDQMADMGFLPEVTALLDQTPRGGQRLLFSATLDRDVDALVRRFLSDPVLHSTDEGVAAVDTMAHHALLVPPRDKFDICAAIANRPGRTIMFVRTQAAADELVDQFAAVGVRAGALHGGKTQRLRTRTLAEFREGLVNALVATNVAARGIHVDGVSLVVHVDPPKDFKDYLHRAGRTARAGESGTVVTLVLPRQRRATFSMMERAGVDPVRTEVTRSAPALAEVTGARTPSGVPVVPRMPTGVAGLHRRAATVHSAGHGLTRGAGFGPAGPRRVGRGRPDGTTREAAPAEGRAGAPPTGWRARSWYGSTPRRGSGSAARSAVPGAR